MDMIKLTSLVGIVTRSGETFCGPCIFTKDGRMIVRVIKGDKHLIGTDRLVHQSEIRHYRRHQGQAFSMPDAAETEARV